MPVAFSFFVIPALLLGIIRRAGYWDDKLSDYALASIKVTTRPNVTWGRAEMWSGRSRSALGSPIRQIVYQSRSVLTSLIFQRLLQHSSLYQREDIASDICDWLLRDRWPSSALPVSPWGVLGRADIDH